MDQLKILFTNKSHGDLTASHAIEQFLTKQNIPSSSYIMMEQIHGKNIAVVTDKDQKKSIPVVDGIVLQASSLRSTTTLIIRTADCLPLFFIDTYHSIYAAVHAGWKGLHESIIKEVLQIMESAGARRNSIEVHIGPHIQSCCYIVSEKRKTLFEEKFTKPIGDRYTLDLGSIAESQLIEFGMKKNNIFHSKTCTCCTNNEYFSHRRSMIQPQNHLEAGRQVGILSISRYN